MTVSSTEHQLKSSSRLNRTERINVRMEIVCCNIKVRCQRSDCRRNDSILNRVFDLTVARSHGVQSSSIRTHEGKEETFKR